MSPTARTLKLLRDDGYTACVAESWIPRVNIRRDLFGCIDVVAMRAGLPGLLGVQTTTGDHHADRLAKCLASESMRLWVECGNRLWVLSWRQSEPSRRWIHRGEEIELCKFAKEVV